MAEVSWTVQALDDLDAICLFIARDAPRFAAVIAVRIFHAADRAGEFPRSGRVVPEIGREEIREIVIQSYRLIYRTLDDEVEILALHHAARPIGNTGV